ncbi:2-C-methyl-D-erythritol 4-phosphate cytidylyltransferase [Paenibacillus sambharensis]|uniref:2-C-methyl-D-erythritol 4-phosphate cytidylyltransferase n=1 Tax=Paenibacillus sambharensis TaxID=1803190 RepID=A0A2W1LCX0_9BACL|nr:2-C-methyl-D-erythritol 4-phosphate cytidylyltransferase [Paenibacillus sambharensis]PZD96966.1 2-C-methyl-D-erythritol 4-phosphate cytidylyltransferase [Paenibacillus sambharensis]
MMSGERTWSAIVVAAGRGTRMGTAESKQYLPLLGKPILIHTLQLFERMEDIAETILVTGENDIERCRELVREYGLGKVKAVVPGGAERQHSVYQGLKASGSDWVLVHDAVRPLVSPLAVRRCMAAAVHSGAAVLAVPVKDTIKKVGPGGVIEDTPDRSSLWAIQTPQAFNSARLMECHVRAEADAFVGTDDAMLVERCGQQVTVAEGEYTNIKITTPEDLPWAAFLLEERDRRGGNREGE